MGELATIVFEDLSLYREISGGYYDPQSDEIHIDTSISANHQTEVLIHEVLESCLHLQFKHSFIEVLTSKIHLALRILEERNNGNAARIE